MRRLAALLLISLWPRPAAADERPPASFEPSIAWGATRALSRSFTTVQPDAHLLGLFASGHLALRLRHPVMAFVDGGTQPVIASDDPVDLGRWGGRVIAHSRLDALHLLGGAELPLGPVRVWGGMGAFWLTVRSTVLGSKATSTDLSYGYAAGASVHLVARGPFVMGVTARALLLSEAEIIVLQGGLSLGLSLPSPR